MKSFGSFLGLAATPALALFIASGANAQCTGAVPGPDVIVGDLPDWSGYGVANGKRAYAIGTTSCNLGQIPLRWDDTTNLYPVISQNMYKLQNGRFEQLGQAWLKHGFAHCRATSAVPARRAVRATTCIQAARTPIPRA